MKQLYSDYDPYRAVTEASFTNMAMSRVLLTAETCYTLTFMWQVYYNDQLKMEMKRFEKEMAETAGTTVEESDNQSIDKSIEVALLTICYIILITIFVQMFAVVNQRRYRSGFWLAPVTFFLSLILFLIIYFQDGIKMTHVVDGDTPTKE